MIKKAIMILTGAMLATVLFTASAADVKAALPCTYDIINDANANIAKATQGYEAAKATEASLLATFNAVKADPAHSQIQYEQAAFNYNNAVNQTQWWLAQLNNAKAYLVNINARGDFEDKYIANQAAAGDLTLLKASKQDADGAANIANSTTAFVTVPIMSHGRNFPHLVLVFATMTPIIGSLNASNTLAIRRMIPITHADTPMMS